jgi:hypothetical protein
MNALLMALAMSRGMLGSHVGIGLLLSADIRVGGARGRMRASLLVLLVLFAACASVPTDTASLQAQGYKKLALTFVTGSGERRESPNYEVWWKDTRDADRRTHYCLVPKISGSGYNWRITVFVNEKEAWSYDSGGLAGRPAVKQGIDCTTSPALPEGSLTWRVNYTYW